MQVYANQGDNLDALIYRHLGESQGLLEQTLELNPKLSLNEVLPLGLAVTLPEQTDSRLNVKTSIKLWD